MADKFSFDTEKYVLIGKVTRAHGIKGELKIRPFSGQLQSITRHNRLLLASRQNGLPESYKVSRTRAATKEALVLLEGVDTRNRAEELCGLEVLAYKDDLPVLAADEFYLHELEGLLVQTEDGRNVGTIDAFFDNGVHDILVVVNGKEETLIPLVPGMITARDNNTVTIAPPPGLLDVNADKNIKGDKPHDV